MHSFSNRVSADVFEAYSLGYEQLSKGKDAVSEVVVRMNGLQGHQEEESTENESDFEKYFITLGCKVFLHKKNDYQNS